MLFSHLACPPHTQHSQDSPQPWLRWSTWWFCVGLLFISNSTSSDDLYKAFLYLISNKIISPHCSFYKYCTIYTKCVYVTVHNQVSQSAVIPLLCSAGLARCPGTVLHTWYFSRRGATRLAVERPPAFDHLTRLPFSICLEPAPSLHLPVSLVSVFIWEEGSPVLSNV